MARRAFLALAAAGLLAGCGTDDAADPLVPSGPTGRIRVVNLVTDAARVPLNAAVEGVPFGVNLAFGATAPASLPAPNTALYSAILTGPRAVVFRRTADTSVTVLSTSVTIAENRDYTVYAIGGTGGAAATAFVTTDTNTVVASTSTRVRVVHLASTAGNVDIFVTAPNADLAAATPTLSNVPFRGVSGYLTVPAATYQIRVVPAGTAPAARAGAVALNVPTLALPGGGARTIVAADAATGSGALRSFVYTDR